MRRWVKIAARDLEIKQIDDFSGKENPKEYMQRDHFEEVHFQLTFCKDRLHNHKLCCIWGIQTFSRCNMLNTLSFLEYDIKLNKLEEPIICHLYHIMCSYYYCRSFVDQYMLYIRYIYFLVKKNTIASNSNISLNDTSQ